MSGKEVEEEGAERVTVMRLCGTKLFRLRALWGRGYLCCAQTGRLQEVTGISDS